MSEEKKTIRIKVIEVSDITTKDGKKFKAFKTVGKGGRKMDLRFVREATNVPTEPCVIVVLEDNANVDTTRQYPILWVKDVLAIEPIAHKKNNVADFIDP